MKIGSDRHECKINDVEITQDTLSNRGGLSFMLRYLDSLGLLTMIEEKFSDICVKVAKVKLWVNVHVNSLRFAWMEQNTQ